MTRLVTSVLRGYFVYMGNRQTRKAGGYVKELCTVIRFAMRHQSETGEDVALLNFTTAPAARVEEFVEAIQLTGGVSRKLFSVPRGVALGMSYLIDAAAQTLRIKQPIAPTRVRGNFPFRQTWRQNGVRALGTATGFHSERLLKTGNATCLLTSERGPPRMNGAHRRRRRRPARWKS